MKAKDITVGEITDIRSGKRSTLLIERRNYFAVTDGS